MNNGNPATTVRFPALAQDDAGQDLSTPVVLLLRDLNVLGSPEDLKKADGVEAALNGPPQSVAIIEAGATALGKWWTAALGVGATLTSIVATAQGIWGQEHDIVRVAFVGGAAAVLTAIAIAIAIIVSSDVRGRAVGSVAQIQARAQVAQTFLALSRTAGVSLDGSADGSRVASTAPTNIQLDVISKGAAGTATAARTIPIHQLQVKVGSDWVAVRRAEVVPS